MNKYENVMVNVMIKMHFWLPISIVIRKENLYVNLKKCTFLQTKSFSEELSSKGVSADLILIKAIVEWLESCNIKKVRSFHGAATLYKRFMWNFSTIMIQITDLIK